MTRVYVDATTLVALGQVGAIDLLDAFEGTVVVPESDTDEEKATQAEPFRPAILLS